MALPAYMFISAETQGDIEGDCELDDREGAIVLQGFEHVVEIPTDDRGAPAGRRIHRPITVLKETDRTTPMLYQALCSGELLTEVTIDWYQLDGAGMEELYYRITLTNAIITSVRPSVPIVMLAENQVMGHLEKVSLIYDEIIWSHEVDGIEFEDTWDSAGA